MEVNFWDNQENARSKVETSYGRFTSRLGSDQLEMVGNFIIDSSAKGNNSAAEWFLEQTDPEKTWNCKPTHYQVRGSLYQESKGKTFSVYTGDGKYPPQILAEDYKLGLDQDPDKVLKVPVQLLPEAKMNLEKMLQDKCGISTASSDSFFGGSVDHLINCSKGKRNVLEEVYIVDFFDKTDRLIDKIAPALRDIPRQSTIWLGLDLATSSDYTGISAVGFNGWEKINDDTKLPKIKVYFSFAVSRKEGQQTSLFHIFDLIKALSRMYNVIVSADQAFSPQILQDCERDGIKTNGRISTDNSPCLPALYLKNMIQQELLELPPNRRLFREAYDLKYVTTKTGKVKIDHPRKATIDSKVFDGDASKGIGSKDVWDSLASACYSLKMSIDVGEELGYNSGYEKQLDLVSKMTNNAREESSKQIQNMVEGIFGEW